MRYSKNIVLLLVVVVTLTLATVVASLRAQKSIAPRNTADDEIPIANYEAPVSALPEERLKRQRRSERYDQSHLVTEPQKRGGAIITIDHTIGRMPALPVNLSDAIVIGNVIDVQAHLSNDKSGVYTESTIHADEILRDTTGTLQVGSPIVTQRAGGRVRFASGNVQTYKISYLGTPRRNRRYAFFLKRNDGSDAFTIVTGYELRAGQIHPLDGVNMTRRGVSELPQFAAFKSMDETEFRGRILAASVVP